MHSLVAILILLLAPFVTHAATLTELQTQLAQLMTQIAVMQSQTYTTAPVSSGVTLASCPNLSRNLSRGTKGNDVTQLQQFLINQKLLPADSATGFYGAMTEAAVKKFQCTNMSICSGSPSTTGYGAVGPRTRAALSSCKVRTSQIFPTSGSVPENNASAPSVTGQAVTPSAPSVSIAPAVPASVSQSNDSSRAKNCNVFRYGQDVYMGVLDSNKNRLFDLRLGSAGVISSLRGPDYQELLAKSFGGERTDRVVQWVIWGKDDLHSLTGPGASESTEWYKNAFNITQAGSFEDRATDSHLQDTLWVEAVPALCIVDIYAAPSKQWYSALTSVFPAKLQSLTRYTITADSAIRIQRFILLPHAFDEFRFDAWTPFAKSQLDRLAFDMNDAGAVTSSTGASIGYLDQDVTTFQSGKGYSVAYNSATPTAKPAIGVVFGNKQPCNGSPCASVGSDTSDAIANAQSVVAPANHPCKKLPLGCGWNKSTFNVMDWEYGEDKGLTLIPTTHLTNVPAGSLYTDEMYLVLRANGLSSELQNTVARLSQDVAAPALIYSGQTVSTDLNAIRTRLTAHTSYTGVQADQLGIYPIEGI